MNPKDGNESFQLAPMSPFIRLLTIFLLFLPPAFLIGGWLGDTVLLFVALFLAVIYAWVWFGFRPTLFVVRSDVIEVIWPFKRREIARNGITEIRFMDSKTLYKEIGWGMRIGGGGLWGGFGWLWTQKRGIVQMYVSRTDSFVWIERGDARPWLITPERPEVFVQALQNRNAM